jgi:5''-3'' exonuclease (including N-terminal domain of PolI)
MNKNKLFLLDAYALIYRSYYAFIKNPRVDSKGRNTSAIFGFVNTLEEVLRKENPSHIAVAFDPAGPTFRHVEFEAYKAQREATPEDIKLSIPIIKEIIRAYNIPVLEVAGYEADDVIGTIAKHADKDRFDVFMMTPDKDYGQLLTEPHLFIYKPKYGSNDYDLLDDKKVMEKYSLSHPRQMIDLLGLMGDTSDNIPGCPGVGEKTAAKLLHQFGSIENLIENTHQLKGALKTKIEENRDQILFSKFLATIKTDVPIEVKEDDFVRKEINEKAIKALFEELEFRTLIGRVLKQEPAKIVSKGPIQGELFSLFDDEKRTGDHEKEPAAIEVPAHFTVELPANFTDIHTTPHLYTMVPSEEGMAALSKKLCAQKSVCFDTETTGMDPLLSDLVGLSFAYKEGEAFYVPISADPEEAQKQVEIFRPFFEDERIDKVGQNLKYDILELRNYGIQVKGTLFDTMIAHYLLNPEIRHGMDYMAEIYLKYRTIHIEELIGPRGKNQKNMRDVAPVIVSDYAAEDADITLKLKNILEKEIRENNLSHLFYDIESPLTYVLADMEWTGVRLDVTALNDLSKQYTEELLLIEKEIAGMAGTDFNVNSPKQIGEVLFDRMKIIDKPKKPKRDNTKPARKNWRKSVPNTPLSARFWSSEDSKNCWALISTRFPFLSTNEPEKSIPRLIRPWLLPDV